MFKQDSFQSTLRLIQCFLVALIKRCLFSTLPKENVVPLRLFSAPRIFTKGTKTSIFISLELGN